ncbi:MULTISPECIES: DoxX family protein [unclassified Corynebacterium]|uniref:DoxX family protein n=1 Tax=unclassified Corynebacterium TaxID=2624378 RepID=UPI001EF577CF|nr:DoxX family protein [Corynebacterium sp. ACRQK]MCG7262546.1 DoxX family protein [Corynebacterium sp. ACRQL]
MNNNAKPNSPDDALFGNSADDLTDDLNNDIDVPVYRRDAQKPADSTPPAKATKIDKPGGETVGEETVESSAAEDAKPEPPAQLTASKPGAKSAKTSDPVESDSAAAVAAEDGSNKGTGSDGASADPSAGASAEASGAEAPEAEAPVEEKPAKRDIYAVLGRARPQRIESRPPEPEVDLSKLDASQSAAGAGVAGADSNADARANAGDTHGPSDRWGKVDDANPAEQATASTNDQAFIRQAKIGADTDRSTAGAGAAGADAGAAGAGVTGAGAAADATGAAGAAGAGTVSAADGSEFGGTDTPGSATGAVTVPETAADADRDRDAAAAAGAGAAGTGAVAGADRDRDAAAAAGAEVGGADATAGAAGAGAEVKRGTTSFGLFILRAVLGAYLLVRGLQTLFAFGGDPGVDVFQSQLENYNFTDILAIGIPVAEVVAGGLLLLGLVTPFGAALATIVGGFMAFHNLDSFQGTLWPYGLNPHVQLWAALTVVSISLIFLGPGRISLDRSRGWATRPLASAWIFFVVAAATTAGLWLGVGGGNPFN